MSHDAQDDTPRRKRAPRGRLSHDLRAVQMMLGHASLATTQVYLGIGLGDMRAALAA